MGTDGGADKQKAGAAHEGKDENCSAMTAAPTSKNAGAAHECKDEHCSAMRIAAP